ncbi:MAG: PDZ domain-containing protein [Longimicrobiales bacterium]
MRYLTMMRKAGLWILLAALAQPSRGGTQEVAWSVQTNRGWIGVEVVYTTALVGGDESTVGVIDDVAEGSPAEAAGIQVGDTLTHLDGQPISQRVLTSLQRSLEIGDLVRLTILRNGRSREVLVEAAPQKAGGWVFRPNSGEMVIHLDSVKGAILQSLDSLRLSITRLETDSTGEVSIRILSAPEPPEKHAWLDMTYRMWEPGLDTIHMQRSEVLVFEPDFPVPFEAIVVSSEETQELRDQLKKVRSELTEARRQELARVREIEAATQGPAEEAIRRDPRIREIREREAELAEEITSLNQQLEQASEVVRRRQFAEVHARQEEALSAARRAQAEATSRSRAEREESLRARELLLQEEYELRRPQNYIIAGQSFVAGAQLQPLNPDLASYFHVEEGLLVTEVLEGTPAFEAGLLAGDVITRVGGQRVASLNDLRFGIGYLERPLRLQVIRKGDSVGILIR